MIMKFKYLTSISKWLDTILCIFMQNFVSSPKQGKYTFTKGLLV